MATSAPVEEATITPENPIAAPLVNAEGTNGTHAATSDDENSFGDLLAQLLRTLPSEASSLFLMSLSGLSSTESSELCEYVNKLRTEKQFRVIRAMAESTLEGKKKFLTNLRKKIQQQEAQQRIEEEKDMEAQLKRKQAINAATRVKMLNGETNKYHSFNAIIGPGGVKENKGNSANTSPGLTPEALAAHGRSNGIVSRSMSSSSVASVTKEDLKQVRALLGGAHIGESEMNLRELEISKKGFANGKQTSQNDDDSAMDNVSKRDRPESMRELVQTEQKPNQRTRSDQEPISSTSGGTTSPTATENESQDGGADYEDPEAPTTKRWTKSQDAALRESVRIHGEKNWKAIAELVPGRNHAQCLQRWRKVLKPGLVKGHWSFEEDQVLEYLVTQGCNNWGQIAERIPGRTPKQCRERWKNHLDPAINKGPYTEEEDTIILTAQAKLGNKWSQIAQLLKGRTEDSVKIRWKSLKQNPSKAAASHAQHKKNQQQQAQQQQALSNGGMQGSYNPALIRQRQLHLLQQQQQMQHSEATQQLEHQQQLQQQQLQMRLHEKLMHQQQLHRQQMHHQPLISDDMPPGSFNGIKPEPYQSPSRMVPQMVPSMGMPQDMYPTSNYQQQPFMTQLLQKPSDPAQHYEPHEYVANGGGYGNYRYSNGQYHRSPGSVGDNSSPSSQNHHHSPADQSENEHGDARETWGVQHELSDGLGRLGENPPPSTFWENYPKQHMGGHEPLSLQAMLQEPHRPHHTGGAGVHEDEVYDAMFEKLATEFGTQDLPFTAI